MKPPIDGQMLWLFGGVLGTLSLATGIGHMLGRWVSAESSRATVENLKARIRAWWVMCGIFAGGLLVGEAGPIALFGLIAFLALREFLSLVPARRGDHRTLCWAFFAITPLQFALVGLGWFTLLCSMIPVYAFLLVPARSVLSGDPEHFLERTAEIQWGLMICVYCVSFAPALLRLRIPGYAGQNGKLLLFLVLVVQASDVLQYIWGKLLGRRKIAPRISPNKTWEGFLGGLGCATLLGTSLWWATPFSPWRAAGVSLLITLAGFAGGLTMSAIKRDRGVKDFGSLIPGHGGVLDRVDSLCFAAPVFFHVVRYLCACP